MNGSTTPTIETLPPTATTTTTTATTPSISPLLPSSTIHSITGYRHNSAATEDEEPASFQQQLNGVLDAYLTYLYTRTKETLEHLLVFVLVYAIVCLGVYKFLHYRRCQTSPADAVVNAGGSDDAAPVVRQHAATNNAPTEQLPTPPAATAAVQNQQYSNRAVRFPHGIRRMLLVIAHPDDECMFFGPTLLALSRRRNCQVYVLCLSSGNYAQLGTVRRKELWHACSVLRVRPERITLVQATQLPDDPQATWPAEVVARHIRQHVEQLDIDAVCTFDRDGISQHPNHRAVFYATASLFVAGLLPKRCRVLTLDSTNTLRKYSFVFDVLLTLLLSTHWCVASWSDVQLVRHAMAHHRSQMVWFRRLYVLCSRYMIINSWREMSVSDVELDLQIDEDL